MSDLATLLRTATQQAMRTINTCLPGTILNYNAGAQSASVQPMLKLRQPDGREESIPVLNNVPVIWPRSGGASLTFPVRAGDGCLVMFTQRSIDEYKSSGEVSIPLDPRAYDLSDAVAIMGFVSFGGGGGADDAVELNFGSSKVTLKENTVEVTGTAITLTGAVTVAGNLTVSGAGGGSGVVNINAPLLLHNGTNVGDSHTHSGVQTGGGTTGAPT